LRERLKRNVALLVDILPSLFEDDEDTETEAPSLSREKVTLFISAWNQLSDKVKKSITADNVYQGRIQFEGQTYPARNPNGHKENVVFQTKSRSGRGGR
jgi:hypothetical protein